MGNSFKKYSGALLAAFSLAAGPAAKADVVQVTLTPAQENQDMVLKLSGLRFRTYVLEAATNLGPATVWTPVATNIANSAGFTTFRDTNAVSLYPQRFYRAQQL